jgi:hypothetical protein
MNMIGVVTARVILSAESSSQQECADKGQGLKPSLVHTDEGCGGVQNNPMLRKYLLKIHMYSRRLIS